jgi:ribosomal protein S18 acetylase RimI-like enzyme
MPPRVRPPDEADASSVLQVIVARDVAELGVPDFTLDDLKADAALGERWEGGTGYVAELGVLRRARGRGLGRALLLRLFEAFRHGGLTRAELSVHGRSRGALALYESAGMRTTWEAERWEKALGRA